MTLAVAAIAWWAASRTRPPGPGPIHFEFRGLPNQLVRTDPNQFAISPDGSALAFIAVDSTGQSLWLWRLRENQSRELGGTRGAKHPFWSPDGKQVGFFADGKMRRVPSSGGDPEVICDAPQPHGATWGRKGIIVFAPNSQGPLYRVPATGGTAEITTPAVDTTRGMNAHAWPSFLPDGEHFIYIERRSEPRIIDEPPAKPGPWTSFVGSIRSRQAEPLLVANSAPTFAAPHYLVFIRDGVLLAQDFDVHRRRVRGRPVRIADSPDPMAMYGTRCGSASANGVLIWQSFGSPRTKLAWVDRNARRIRELGVAPEPWSRGMISPDGRRALLRKEEENSGSSLWVLDLEREVATPLTSGPAAQEPGVWSPDGKEVIYSSRAPGGVCDLHRIAVDRPESDRIFYRSTGHLQNAFGWSPDARWVLVQDLRAGTGFDLLIVPAQGGAPRPYLTTRFNERRAEISPDGKWALYCSDEAGPLQAYVQSFPNPGEKQQVSTAPLHAATWGKQGHEILLFGMDYRVQSVPVETGKELRLGAARELFAMPSDTRWIAPAPDGQRFLLFEPEEPATHDRSIAVNVNWTAGLRR
jgi:Tol biopolymer transport system component